HPPAARAMLEYRIRRLPAALAAARALGRAGARFPWESARDGTDVTPSMGRDQSGRVFPIRTGQLEEHVVADVAWAAWTYMAWTHDEEFIEGPGRRLLVETARYWASRVRITADGRGHIFGVTGPDEYHEPVDDNAFTNVMARWNLRRAAASCADVDGEEVDRWLSIADAIVDNYHDDSGLYEQFSGFWKLEPLVIADLAPRRPIAAELLLGRDRIQRAQVVKQADVLMLHHMVPAEVAAGSLDANLEYYEPRTAHGSSLSPGVHAALFARAGRMSDAVRALHLASRLDLDDLTGTTAAGLHVATMGSVWQAMAYGFAGLRPSDDALHVDPRIPPVWRSFEINIRFRGTPVRIVTDMETTTVTPARATRLQVGDGSIVECGPQGLRLERSKDGWVVGGHGEGHRSDR
ncbi:MAG TPA: glycosyl hydrolase family 65 protein, partial [Actinomycetota bacterium]|nr:glycosyl hydrolase family 65 protein [Actinomycetota bacterium]